MSVAARLAGFAAVLAIVFAGAALAGSATDPHPGTPEPAEAQHGMGAEGAMQAVRGLAVSDDDGLSLRLATKTARPGQTLDLSFTIVDDRGETVRDFDVEHTKRMHFIVVRRDMTGFQHLHPVQQPDGSWTVPATLRDAGTYRVFADFSVDDTPHTLADDLTVDGTVHSQELPTPTTSVDVDGLRVQRSGLDFTVTRAGRPAAIEDYLGAKGHLVALREGDLAFLHVHPDENSLRFETDFPTAGRYRLFLQFKTEGRVHTAAFTQEVSR